MAANASSTGPSPAPDGAGHCGPDPGPRVGRGRLVAAAERSAADADATTRTSPARPTPKNKVERATQLRSDPDAWKAVLDYFPDDRVYTVQAKERLAVLYLRTLRLKEAGKLFSELEGMGRENPKEHSIGLRAKRSSPRCKRTTASRSR